LTTKKDREINQNTSTIGLTPHNSGEAASLRDDRQYAICRILDEEEKMADGGNEIYYLVMGVEDSTPKWVKAKTIFPRYEQLLEAYHTSRAEKRKGKETQR